MNPDTAIVLAWVESAGVVVDAALQVKGGCFCQTFASGLYPACQTWAVSVQKNPSVHMSFRTALTARKDRV
jgi:hypothetical protein